MIATLHRDLTLIKSALVRGQERLSAIADAKRPWAARHGKLALGYVSRVDDSIQPYGLIVPKNYDPKTASRLDVVLHGSSKPVGLSELKFISRFDNGDVADASPPEQPFIELHPLGRVENCYRWAGETDVFEAIEDVCRRYNIDRRRIVLRGMLMGASGTWHLGLKHPDRFVALGPYCGYVDTHRFSETPLPNFVKVGPLPDHQERGCICSTQSTTRLTLASCPPSPAWREGRLLPGSQHDRRDGRRSSGAWL
jgi:poly(3-hydroxybutyrate) depolymerase